MTRKLKTYSYADSCNSYLPPDVIAMLGERSHVRQGDVYIWAATAKDAVAHAADLGLLIGSTRELRVVTHGTGATLNAAHVWSDGTVLAVRLSGGGPVIEITANPDQSDRSRILDGVRVLRVAGELRHGINFHPADDLEPVVTDAMVDAAWKEMSADVVCGETHLDEETLRTAIAAALRVQRDGS